ncbi:MAG: class I SAM-dependent methyltransferase [Verrucomicrobiota bacterium]|jgi:2-polyprenyl-3-methyl-5-hydroxy-6-metoxy-1,4-benzoquinol methylase|nr:class I SAM-dependent methyltransferase [Verrucomicrobiota bacterium]
MKKLDSTKDEMPDKASAFQPHDIEWTPEKITRFWMMKVQNPSRQYFSSMHCGEVVRVAEQQGVLQEPVLDFGAGPGYLTEYLLQKNIHCSACDSSPESMEELASRMARYPSFGKAYVLKDTEKVLPSNTFGLVFLCEVMEHVLPDARPAVLATVRDSIREMGYVLVTVPNEENLKAKFVFCADCGAAFHPVQHVASFDKASMTNMMEENGFSTVFCEPVRLWQLAEEQQRLGKRLRRGLRKGLEHLHLVSPHSSRIPNLVYIGRKTGTV